MTRPNAFGVIERVLNLQDSLAEANHQLNVKNDLLRKLTEQITALQKEVRGFDEILQQSIHEKFQMQERHAAEINDLHDQYCREPTAQEVCE